MVPAVFKIYFGICDVGRPIQISVRNLSKPNIIVFYSFAFVKSLQNSLLDCIFFFVLEKLIFIDFYIIETYHDSQVQCLI